MDTVDDIERAYYEALKKLVKLGSWPGTYCDSTSVCPLWNIDPAKYENASEIARLARRADVAERSAEWLRKKLKECQEDTIPMLIIRAEKAERERDAAVKTIFEYTGCPECKHWNGEDEWCEKHDREAGAEDGCSTPEWRGQKEE